VALVAERLTVSVSNWLARPGMLFIFLLLVTVRAFAGSATLAWDPVTDPDLSGYILHHGPTAGNYTAEVNVGNKTSYMVSGLTEGSTYHFAVTAYDASGKESAYSNDVSAFIPYSAPVAAFSASTTSGTAPLAMNFVNSSTGNITAYAWTFGDGGTSTVRSPSHLYSSPGIYTVMLKVTGAGGTNTQTKTNYVTVKPASTPAPVAAFSVSATSGTAPLTVNFSSTSTGTIASYAWTFGDGTTSTAQNSSHVYSLPGVYTASLKVTGPGGSNTASKSVTVTAVAGATCPCSLWSGTALPKLAADADASPVEVGVKFKSDKNGAITGIRYYKSASNTGTHVGSLWTSGGQLLARATFTNEKASGWQQVDFATPVAIVAGSVYVASYHTNSGHYASDDYYFATKGVDNGPLHALRDGVSGNNGVYAYGAYPAFPRSSYRATNYWVDVVFKPAN